MKPTKARLRNRVIILENQVIRDIEKDRDKAVHDHIISWWESNDAELTKLRGYFEANQEKNNAKDSVLDFIQEHGLEVSGFYRDAHYKDFEAFQNIFFDRVRRRTVKGLQKVSQPFGKDIEEVKETYKAVRSNLDKLTAKKGLDYLKELGLDVTVFETEDAQLPMVVVDKSKLRIPAKEDDAQ